MKENPVILWLHQSIILVVRAGLHMIHYAELLLQNESKHVD